VKQPWRLDATDWRADGLLLDVMMPGLDGVATLREIRQRPQFAATPAAFISAKRDPSLATVDPYVVGMLEKPFDPMTLAARLLELFSNCPSEAQDRAAAHAIVRREVP
jgi:CheY-like chemotaxis protein